MRRRAFITLLGGGGRLAARGERAAARAGDGGYPHVTPRPWLYLVGENYADLSIGSKILLTNEMIHSQNYPLFGGGSQIRTLMWR
jgi:hypothetical protein